MKKRLVLGIVIVLIVAVAAYFIIFGNSNNNQTAITESAAKWIGAHSTVYVQKGCIHCIEQENMFGGNWKYVNSVDCIANDTNTQICINANITGTPTWIINGKYYVGVQSIAQLENLTGYK